MKVAEVVAGVLAEEGIRYVFGLPGSENLDLMEALRQRGVQFVLCKHENHGAFMAEACGLHTGKPGVILTTRGPGVTNVLSGIAHAHLDRSPLIVFTGGGAEGSSHVLPHQEYDLPTLLAPISKWSTVVPKLYTRRVIRKGLKLATTGVPGPVHFALPDEVAEAEAKDPMAWEGDRNTGPITAQDHTGSLPRRELIDQLAVRLAAARRPVVLSGIGAMRGNGQQELASLLEIVPMPVVTSFKSKGVLDERHPCSAGVYGIPTKAQKMYFDMVRESDLVIAIGYDAVEQSPAWEKVWDASRTIVNIDWNATAENTFSPNMELVGDPWATLAELRQRLQGVKPQSEWSPAAIVEFKRTALVILEGKSPREGTLSPNAVIGEVRRLCPDNTIVTVDVGSHKIAAAHFWQTHEVQGFMMSNGQSGMGYGLPAAIGAQLANPDRHVVCITGDGGFYMVMSELETARRLGLPIIVVVLNDGTLHRIRVKQEQRRYTSTGLDFSFPDGADIARAFQIAGQTVDTMEALQAAVTAAVTNRQQPTLIVAKIDPAVYNHIS